MKKMTQIKIINLFLLPLVSAMVLSVSAIPSGYYFFSFVALVPLIFALDWVSLQKRAYPKGFLQLFITFITFYLWEGGWILQTASLGFLLFLFVVIPFIALLLPYLFFKKKKSNYALLYFIVAWLLAELVENYFELGSPFYSLGHNLAVKPQLIQWYEFTGVAGGTLWILMVNAFFYLLLKNSKIKGKRIKKTIISVLIITIMPVILSVFMYHNYVEKGEETEVLLVHPSTDNKSVKYKKGVFELMDFYTEVMKPKLTKETEYVVLPETAITNAGWVSYLNKNKLFDSFLENTADYPHLKLISGAVAYEAIRNVKSIKNYERIPGIRFSEKYKVWYYTYNAAVKIEKNQPAQIRVKDYLVPYQEYAPYPTVMPRLTPVGIDFQFSTRKNNRTVFNSKEDKAGALICYEVVYGNIAQNIAKKGAEIIFVILNEGWYNIPKVPKQFLQLSTIRAIENRKSVVHCSNMGISAFINQKGNIIAKTSSKNAEGLNQKVKRNKEKTFYTNYQQYIELFIVLLFLLPFLMQAKKRKHT